ncbi:hypothetical protein J3R30DRAFT_2384486 [Lentinula aciculospora]|uniref:Uncharacterized protein n=1 Tax=Lentinula aciculospora TaxID=153920 RepID=A0A9W9AFX9_9AGAR|nr:hypothetical protein J3R30DRAFT_2384486 [Lentinula aciculospora]
MSNSTSMKESWGTTQTIVRIAHPERYSGLERIMLAAQGDLQRLLSAFFADIITVQLLYATNTPRTTPASPSSPIIQTRKVELKCRSVVVCTATSTVTLTSPECERLILDEGFAIGQTFRQMGKVPEFELGNVEIGKVAGSMEGEEELRRTYTLMSPGIECEILEVFSSRDMFVDGEESLKKKQDRVIRHWSPESDTSSSSD